MGSLYGYMSGYIEEYVQINRRTSRSRGERYTNLFFFTYGLFVLFVFETGSHPVALTSLEFTIWKASPKLTESYLSCPPECVSATPDLDSSLRQDDMRSLYSSG